MLPRPCPQEHLSSLAASTSCMLACRWHFSDGDISSPSAGNTQGRDKISPSSTSSDRIAVTLQREQPDLATLPQNASPFYIFLTPFRRQDKCAPLSSNEQTALPKYRKMKHTLRLKLPIFGSVKSQHRQQQRTRPDQQKSLSYQNVSSCCYKRPATHRGLKSKHILVPFLPKALAWKTSQQPW